MFSGVVGSNLPGNIFPNILSGIPVEVAWTRFWSKVIGEPVEKKVLGSLVAVVVDSGFTQFWLDRRRFSVFA